MKAERQWQRAANDEASVTGAESSERFAKVVFPHLGDALALARWLTGNAADAEDVVQDACMRALAGLGAYAGGNAKAWFLTIVRNASFTWLQKNRPRSLVLVGDLQDLDAQPRSASGPGDEVPGGGTAESPETALIAKADAALVEAAIGNLPQLFREILVLREINGLSYREIAAMLAIPIGTVMSRLARARSLLAADIGGTR